MGRFHMWFGKTLEKKKWNFRNIMIGEEAFLYNIHDLLDWLVKNNIITKWERKRCQHQLDMRNYLSHPVYLPSFPPRHAFRSIKEVTYLINKMFSSLS